MKNLKKVLALVVALTMVFTTVAFASYPDVDVEADYAGAVELLSALDILKGDDNGNFNPDNTITRAEFAAVVCRALGLENSAASAKGATMFKDVAADHWASGYINLASQQGIINGKGNGMFDPEGNVTYAEAVKMLVVAIGYEPMAATKGGWPTGYLSVANSTKMTAGVGGAADVAALRSTVAMLTANAIAIPVMDQTAFGSETKYEPMDDYDNYTSLLSQQDVYVATGIIATVDLLEGEFTFKLTEESEDYAFGWANSYTIDLSKVPASFEIGESNVLDYVNESVDLYVKKSGRNDYVALIAVPSGIGETLTINASDLDTKAATISTSKQVTLEYFETPDADKTTKIYVEKNPTIIVNNTLIEKGEFDNANLYTALDGKDASIKFIENTDDKYFDIVNITVYEHQIVKEVKADKGRIEFLQTNQKIVVDADDDTIIANFADVDGNAIEMADFKEGDVVAMVVSDLNDKGLPVPAKNFKTEILVYNLGASSVTGTLNQANESEGYVYIDGVQYEYNKTFVSEKDYNDLFKVVEGKEDEAKLGTEGQFYLGLTGKIIGFAGVEGSTGNYAFVLQGAESSSTWDKCYQIKVLLADGSVKTYDIDDEVVVYEGKTDKELVYADGDQKAYFEVAEWTKGTKDAYKRVIDFKANSKDVITEITYVYVSTDSITAEQYAKLDEADKANYIKNAEGGYDEVDYATIAKDSEYKAKTSKIDGNGLASDVVIFNVDVTDADDATVVTLDSLVDEAKYEGYVLVKDEKYDVFVMTAGSAKFDAEAPLYVVDSVVKSTYGEDKEASYEVTYYVDGSNETATAIFTADSEKYAASSLAYTTLAKGSLFVANTAADGLVSHYMVLANVNKAGTGYDMTDFSKRFAATFDDEDVEFAYGTIKTIDGAEIAVDGFGDVVVEGGSAQYYFNNEGSKAKLEAGDCFGMEIDEAGDDGANYVFVKLFDGDVTDIVSFSARVK